MLLILLDSARTFDFDLYSGIITEKRINTFLARLGLVKITLH